MCKCVFILNTVKDRDIAQFTNFDLLSDTFNMGYICSRVWHANRRRSLLPTPGPVPFGLERALFVETSDTLRRSEIVPTYDPTGLKRFTEFDIYQL